MRASILIALAGCGRIGFDSATGDGDSDGIAPRTSWVKTYAATTGPVGVRATGAPGGGAVVAVQFVGTVDIAGTLVTSPNAFTNAAAIRLGPSGALDWFQPLHAGMHCDMRVGVPTANGGSLVGGFTMGPLSDGNPCDAGVGGNQDPAILEFGAGGSFVRRLTFDSVGSNGQLYQLAVYSDGSYLVHGIYGGDLTINGQALPSALTTQCEGAFTARVGGATTWQVGLVNTACVYPGPIDLDVATGEACIAGQFDAPTNVFGTMLTPAGAADVWLVRLRPDGTAKFVRGFGSTSNEFPAGVIATSDGGCLLQAAYQGAFDLGGAVGPLAHAGGSDVLIAAFDSAGSARAASTIATTGAETATGLVIAGNKTYAAVGIRAPITIADTMFTPAGLDVVAIELEGTAPSRVLGTIGGGGDVSMFRVSGTNGDVILSGGFTGELTVGSTTTSTTMQSGFVVAFTP